MVTIKSTLNFMFMRYIYLFILSLPSRGVLRVLLGATTRHLFVVEVPLLLRIRASMCPKVQHLFYIINFFIIYIIINIYLGWHLAILCGQKK